MAVLTAVCILLSVLVAIDLLLTVGILRRLRDGADGAPARPVATPARGHRIELGLDRQPWPTEAERLLNGTALVAMVVLGCSTCERLHRAIDELDYGVPIPFLVLGEFDPDDPEGTTAYLATWQGATPVVAPHAFDELDSFGRPDVYPVIMVVENGRVTASGHRLHDVTAAMYEAADRLDAASRTR
ncbi:MAG TPA: hypothetical protein VF557_19380 [Jatrophihabitans sp.]|jgi:hypothetical protein|uniref:hypothetical protein n=1 Tax=Jatrophihabitans sp. TaxID=1932789 RepID=UPI002F116449